MAAACDELRRQFASRAVAPGLSILLMTLGAAMLWRLAPMVHQLAGVDLLVALGIVATLYLCLCWWAAGSDARRWSRLRRFRKLVDELPAGDIRRTQTWQHFEEFRKKHTE